MIWVWAQFPITLLFIPYNPWPVTFSKTNNITHPHRIHKLVIIPQTTRLYTSEFIFQFNNSNSPCESALTGGKKGSFSNRRPPASQPAFQLCIGTLEPGRWIFNVQSIRGSYRKPPPGIFSSGYSQLGFAESNALEGVICQLLDFERFKRCNNWRATLWNWNEIEASGWCIKIDLL